MECGLGFKDFQCHSESLLTQWFTKSLDLNAPGCWHRILSVCDGSTFKIMRRKNYTSRDKIRLGGLQHIRRRLCLHKEPLEVLVHTQIALNFCLWPGLWECMSAQWVKY